MADIMNTEELARYIREITYRWLPEYRYEDYQIQFCTLPYCPPGGTCVFSERDQYYYMGRGDRGSVVCEKHTQNIQEILFLALNSLVTMASYRRAKESDPVEPNESFRRRWHKMHLELAARCGADFYEYTRKQIEDSIRRNPYSCEE